MVVKLLVSVKQWPSTIPIQFRSTSTSARYSSMLAQWWPIVSDDGPALNQHWASISCLLSTLLVTPVTGILDCSGIVISTWQCHTQEPIPAMFAHRLQWVLCRDFILSGRCGLPRPVSPVGTEIWEGEEAEVEEGGGAVRSYRQTNRRTELGRQLLTGLR